MVGWNSGAHEFLGYKRTLPMRCGSPGKRRAWVPDEWKPSRDSGQRGCLFRVGINGLTIPYPVTRTSKCESRPSTVFLFLFCLRWSRMFWLSSSTFGVRWSGAISVDKFTFTQICSRMNASFASPCYQLRLWHLFARHTTMALIMLYLVYTQVSTVVSDFWPQPL